MGWAVAIVASTLGILWSFYSDYPTGPAVVVMLSLSLLLSGNSLLFSQTHRLKHEHCQRRRHGRVCCGLFWSTFSFQERGWRDRDETEPY